MPFFPHIAPITAIPVTVTFTANATDGGIATIFTFSSQSFGTAATDRQIIVAMTTTGGGGGSSGVDTVTIGGSSATLIYAAPGGSDFAQCEFWRRDVPTGTSGDIVITWNREAGRTAIGVYAVYGASTTVYATAVSLTEPDPSTTINIAANGGVIAAATTYNTTSVTYTGVTERYDVIYDTSFCSSGGSDEQLPAETGRTITCNVDGTNSNCIMGVISIQPA